MTETKATGTRPAGSKIISHYYDADAVKSKIARGAHRGVVGGLWDEIGRLQLDFLIGAGLRPEHVFLDVGCGSFRGGIFIADYLDAGNYHGLDLRGELIEAGYEKELKPRNLDRKVPRTNLIESADFNFAAFGKSFDYALALSVFTHLPGDVIKTCLLNLAPVMTPYGAFYASAFECPTETPYDQPLVQMPGGITTYPGEDPYHYRHSDIAEIARSAGWSATWIGDFNHPRNQKMVRFEVART